MTPSALLFVTVRDREFVVIASSPRGSSWRRLDEPYLVDFLGKVARDSNALTVVSWGSIKGVILDATNKLIKEGKMIRFVQLHLLHLFPSRRVKALIGIEMNYSSQLASLINENLRVRMDSLISKYNGRPISSSEIYNVVVRIFSGNAPRRIVLERGA